MSQSYWHRTMKASCRHRVWIVPQKSLSPSYLYLRSQYQESHWICDWWTGSELIEKGWHSSFGWCLLEVQNEPELATSRKDGGGCSQNTHSHFGQRVEVGNGGPLEGGWGRCNDQTSRQSLQHLQILFLLCLSVCAHTFSRSVVSDSLWPHGL